MAKKKRAGGGRTDMVASGNPDVIKEAKGEESYVKKGGRVKKKRDGGPVHRMTGGSVRPRLDRPGRKRGGGVGSDKSPLTGAHNEASAESTPNPNADSN